MIPEVVILNIAPKEREMVERYGINVAMAMHDGLTREIKMYLLEEQRLGIRR